MTTKFILKDGTTYTDISKIPNDKFHQIKCVEIVQTMTLSEFERKYLTY